MTSSLWRLDSDATTMLLHATNKTDVPAIVWIGSRLPDTLSAGEVAVVCDQPLAMAKLDSAVALSLFPQRATDVDSHPALIGHRDGVNFQHQFIRESVVEQADGLTVALIDATAELALRIELKLHHSTGVLSFATTLTNTGGTAYAVDWLASATMQLPDSYKDCLYLHGRWGLEFQAARSQIDRSAIVLQSHRGRTSHELYPGVMLGDSGFSEQHGNVMGVVMAWSGSHTSRIEALSDGRRYCQCGISLDTNELVLEANESFATPVTYFSRENGCNAVSQSLHRFQREQILPVWTRKPRPVHSNSWEALYFDHDIETLKSLIDAAAEVGAERFILDDGWFPARRADTAGLGDWTVDKTIYPDGLHPVVDHVRQHDMQFGLWFEPEMVNPDSELYRTHPEWALHVEGYDTPLARNQLVLNVAEPAVFDYLFESIAALVREYTIDYIKWDHNRDLMFAGDGARSQMHKQVFACYALMQKLNSEFEGLEIESCSSGGARADWGVLHHTGRVWTSDSIDAIDRVNIQRGYSYFNAPEIMGAHVGHAEAHLTGRDINIHTRAIVALQGQYGYEVDARKLDADEKRTLNHYASLYKLHRQWVAECSVWRIDTVEDGLVCTGYVSKDKNRSLWFAVAGVSLSSVLPGRLVMQGLLEDKQYKVSLASSNCETLAKFAKKLPAWLESPVTVNGALLMNMGLTLPVMAAQSAVLIEVSAK